MKCKKELKKIKSIKLKNKKLVKKYPWLKPYNIWNGKLWKDYDYKFTWYDDIPKGWRIAFGKFLLEDINKSCKGEIQFQQIKEKYGSLRIYAVTNSETQDIISKYEFISQYICICCGHPNVGTTYSGWIMPICKECWNKNKYNNKHNLKYEHYIDDKDTEIPNEYKYIRYGSKYENGHIEVVKDITELKNKIIKSWYNKKGYKSIERKEINEK